VLSTYRTGRPWMIPVPQKPGGYGVQRCMLYESKLDGGRGREV